jgi:hypothetical protein
MSIAYFPDAIFCYMKKLAAMLPFHLRTGSSDIKEQSQGKKGKKVRVVWLKYPVKCCI